MEASLVKIGNSQGLIIPKRILKKLGVVKRFNIQEKDGSLLVVPIHEDKPRGDWEKLFAHAIKTGHKPENDYFKDTHNEFDHTEWTW